MKVVFMVNCAFPLGEASSIRAVNLVRLMNKLNCDIHVISDYKGDNCEKLPCTYEFVGKKPNTFKERIDLKNSAIEKLDEYCENNKVDIILTNARFDRCNKIIKISRKHGIRVFIESCEWYNYSNFKFKFLDYRFWLNQKMIYLDFKKSNGFISISRLLNNFNGKKNISVRIPSLIDVKNTKYRIKSNNNKFPIQIVYTGNPGTSKELLNPIIEVLSEDEYLRNNIQFNIYGVNKKQVLKNKYVTEKKLEKADKSVIIHGRVAQYLIHDILLKSDYQLFFRPNRKSSNAGFPTKLAESLSVGTPVITNNTGDIELYIKNNINGYILQDLKKETIKKILLEIIKKNSKDYSLMRENARKTAEKSFEYRKYVNVIKKLFR